MTGKNLFSRYAKLAFALVCVGALHLTIWLNAEKVARPFVQAYVPLTKNEAIKRAVKSCESRFQAYFTDCSTPSEEDISREIQINEERYQYRELRPIEEKIRDVASIMFGIVYAALALVGLWAFKSWFAMNIWPMLAVFFRRLHTSLDLSEREATRRLRRAEEDFRTLKSLRDDGLIAEDVFIVRRNKLKAAISVGTTGNS